MEFFQKFMNRVSRAYGQADKNLFGGFLPGGAATPMGARIQRTIPKQQQPSPVQRRQAIVLDAFSSAAAHLQPTVQRAVRSAPVPVRQVVSGALNTMPFSANMFGRYYTGLGSDGLAVPSEITENIHRTVTQPGYADARSDKAKKQIEMFEGLLASPVQDVNGLPNHSIRQAFVNNLATARSDLRRIESGDIPYFSYETDNHQNPLAAPSTSVGSVWVTPTDSGFKAKDKYDFLYADENRKFSSNNSNQGRTLPSDEILIQAVNPIAIPGMTPGPSVHPLTHFGRSVVMKMPDNSFDYEYEVK